MKKHISMLGLKVEDKVTGYTGIVTSVSFDLYGCVQVLINPGLNPDGKMGELMWMDINRLSPLSSSPVMEVPSFEFGPQAEGLQGASEKPIP